MASREELLRAVRLMKEHCESNCCLCKECPIGAICQNYLHVNPSEWDLEGGKDLEDGEVEEFLFLMS